MPMYVCAFRYSSMQTYHMSRLVQAHHNQNTQLFLPCAASLQLTHPSPFFFPIPHHPNSWQPLMCFPSLCVCEFLSCVQLCDPTHCSLPGSSVHEILQARILEYVTFTFSRDQMFPTQGSKPGLLHWQADSWPSEPPEMPSISITDLTVSHCSQWNSQISAWHSRPSWCGLD